MISEIVNRRGDPRAGFTLIEVVVALAILATGMVLLLETQYATLKLFDEAQELATMQLFVQQAVARAEQAVLTGEADGDGDFGERFPDFSYRFSATEVSQDEVPGLFEVQVAVRGPLDEVELRFMVYDGHQEQQIQ